MEGTLTILFAFALSMSVYSFVWVLLVIAGLFNETSYSNKTEEEKRRELNQDIFRTNVCLILTIVMWTTFFYVKITH